MVESPGRLVPLPIVPDLNQTASAVHDISRPMIKLSQVLSKDEPADGLWRNGFRRVMQNIYHTSKRLHT